MKKNKRFGIRNLFWPGMILLALFTASMGSNMAMFKNRAHGPQFTIFPDPAPPIQISGGVPAPMPAPAPAPRTPAPSVPTAGPGMQEDMNRILAHVLPAVVSVIRPGGGTPRQTPSGLSLLPPAATQNDVTGAGVIVDDRGYVLTTFHTVGSARLVKVLLFQDGQRELMADVIGVDPSCDLALLKIRSSSVFPAARIGDSDRLRVGDVVFALGNPFGFKGTVTMGIVSSNHRKVSIGGVTYPDLIQTDAAINDGNDGGPLVNIRGEVVGVNMATYMPDHRYSGIGFAVPINDAAGLLSGQVQ